MRVLVHFICGRIEKLSYLSSSVSPEEVKREIYLTYSFVYKKYFFFLCINFNLGGSKTIKSQVYKFPQRTFLLSGTIRSRQDCSAEPICTS